ncbi:hypothetical protein CTJ15_03725 (plasmid) [Roseomonas sp. FDAARGOS_362]|uniref:hypothetical protein n=1 Tax=Roseomonas sp. FDAARGOS_362 TaxID=2018065 RepID=UPI000C175BE1|nr:hypothetical protein [Roseomonas sp. FDAARGOS_362]ATR19485.1 hypothetical protein CTJ15_03725 [Roseomonas sp. FDAARGOS_362]
MTNYPLTQLPRAVRRATGHDISYRRFWNAAVDGRIPAEQGRNGRWTWDSDQLPAILEAMGLASAKPSAAVMAA